ncbi:DUF4362 domain-containing protein [Neobacillus novalis]|uniref:DUF4362 domain-containing protein n=1 Tax=Neobacillus novalis TaxID=220687 RepID=A0AA95MN26_9BACI|nr:DUF4362 domain-containing protein [Neobacillus novalis]WHY84051.1 DUF4362 domain-containing protein [Neobacillus novalis]
MRNVFIGITLLVFVITGCQSNNNIEEVINNHNDIQNLEGLKKFVENVNNQNQAEINYVQYGIEGQRGVRTLTFNGEKINVSHSVDGDFIEEFNCNDFIVKTEEDVKKYILSQCTGDFNGDFELLSAPNKDE